MRQALVYRKDVLAGVLTENEDENVNFHTEKPSASPQVGFYKTLLTLFICVCSEVAHVNVSFAVR